MEERQGSTIRRSHDQLPMADRNASTIGQMQREGSKWLGVTDGLHLFQSHTAAFGSKVGFDHQLLTELV